MWPKYTRKRSRKKYPGLEKTLGYRLSTDLLSPTGWLLAARGQMITGELLDQVREAGLEDDLIRLATHPDKLSPPPAVG
ncbi:MAG TPA: hypothetical protein VFS50_14610 [Meiothermus sp.]|jgi:hypothetical protein|nr:hypothetical protein [Meiothermus sp.]